MKIKLKLALLGALSLVAPLPSVRRAYLRCFFEDWNTRTSSPSAVPAFEDAEDDVYNGHQPPWSPRAVPKRIADDLLEKHDASVEIQRATGWDFAKLLQSHL